jgi:hypothetical protein
MSIEFSQHVNLMSTQRLSVAERTIVLDSSEQNAQDLLNNALIVIDSNSHRRHSMDTSQFMPNQTIGSSVVKSQSTIMSLPDDESSHIADQLNLPQMHRKKSVSSKERLFSVDSIHRTLSAKSIEHLMKVATTGQSSDRSDSTKFDEQNSLQSVKQRSSIVNTSSNVSNEYSHMHEENKPTH